MPFDFVSSLVTCQLNVRHPGFVVSVHPKCDIFVNFTLFESFDYGNIWFDDTIGFNYARFVGYFVETRCR